jgi:hypothetical protein
MVNRECLAYGDAEGFSNSQRFIKVVNGELLIVNIGT